MTARVDGNLAEALAPVRDALLAAAERDVDQRIAVVRAQAAEALAAAGRRAEDIISAARAAGVADAEAVRVTERSRARRAARARTLRARREAYDLLRLRSRQAVIQIRDEPGYAVIRDVLTAEAHRLLGPGADITEPDGGGVIGRSGSRSVDLSLAAFADRAVDSVAAGMEQP
jgi:hypothetical protein